MILFHFEKVNSINTVYIICKYNLYVFYPSHSRACNKNMTETTFYVNLYIYTF